MDSRQLPTRAGAAPKESDDEYRRLKSEVGLIDDPVLGLLERYCARARGALDSMEWSWKFEREQALANRVFWLGAGGCRDESADHLNWLIGELGVTSASLAGAREWDEILQVHLERLLVSYAGASPRTGRAAAIKIYLTLDDCDESVYRGLIRPLYRDLPEQCPPGALRP